MTREDLFLAIGQVESSRLSRSERSLLHVEEDKTMYIRPKRTMRNLLAAVLTICMLAVTAYAAAGYLLFDSPEDMISAIFGDKTGFDHGTTGELQDKDGNVLPIQYEYDRVPVEENAAQDVISHVSPVGQSVRWNGFTLTVDSFMYDSATKCGFFTYLLENPQGLPKYRLQNTGEIWYEGVPDLVGVNQYGYPYIIRNRTNDTCLAATYYFQWDERWGKELEICLRSQTLQEQEETSDVIRIPLNGAEALRHETACDGDVVITPICIAMDIRNMEFLRREENGVSWIHTDNIDSLAIRFADGTDYTVFDANTINYGFCVTDLPKDNVQTEVFVSPEEDPNGEGYFYVEDSIGYCLLTTMFNRIIDLDEVSAVVINDVELPLDK